jgi:hypothetical protein
MPRYTASQLRADLTKGWIMALVFSCFAAIPFALMVFRNTVEILRHQDPELPWRTLGAMVLVVSMSYVVASQVGALAFFVLRPLRRSVLGWMATGFAIAVVAYGTVGLAMAIFYDPVGRLFLRDSTPQEAWAMVKFTPFLGIVGALAAAWQWRKARSRRATPSAT